MENAITCTLGLSYLDNRMQRRNPSDLAVVTSSIGAPLTEGLGGTIHLIPKWPPF